MTEKEFVERLQRSRGEINRYVQQDWGRIVGTLAKNHFDDSFRRQGFLDGGLKPWPKRKVETRYPMLRSGRNHLSQNTKFTPGRGTVRLWNDTPYATIHNQGGEFSVTQTITPRMRRFAWAQFYRNGGEKGVKEVPKEAQMWRGMALTKKSSISRRVVMPKRQFMGRSRELDEAVRQRMERDMRRILAPPNLP